MPKVYVVTSGEYSDYHIEQVFLDEQKAEMYKDNINRNNKYGDDCVVEVYDTFDDNISNANMRYIYRIECNTKGNVVTIEGFNNYILDDEIRTSGVEIEVPPVYIDRDDDSYQNYIKKYTGSGLKSYYFYYVINIVTPKLLNYNQIEKIAHDRIAEYEAKENNIV